jgi:hypothetical protein
MAMTWKVIERYKLASLTKIAQGGQGVVYQAPNVTTRFAVSMVYKEYKPKALAEIDSPHWRLCPPWSKTRCRTPRLSD